MNIGSIKWPENEKEAINLYLGFLLKVIDALGIEFSDDGPDPIAVTEKYMRGDISEKDYRATANIWWEYIDDSGMTRDLNAERALRARIAVCLLSVTREEVESLGEHLSWFFEVLEKLGFDLDPPIELMASYFKSRV